MSERGAAADRHVPVMRDRVIELLAPALRRTDRERTVYLDGTLGMGGHAEAILRSVPAAHVIGLDRDPEALALAGERLAAYADRLTLVHAVNDTLPEVLPEVLDALGADGVDAALYDLGVSSLQLDELDRGFAYRVDAPLDMRMDQSGADGSLTAADVLNTYEPAELTRILRDYGEERFARKISSVIANERAREPFTTSGRLVELLRRVIPAASQRSGGHPAKRTFQALRIEVNRELTGWAHALPQVIDALGVGGRVAVLSYHSLEDRTTKQVLAAGAKGSTPIGLPVELPTHSAYLRLLTRGAETPTESEISENPRAASARLRAAERTRTTMITTQTSEGPR